MLVPTLFGQGARRHRNPPPRLAEATVSPLSLKTGLALPTRASSRLCLEHATAAGAPTSDQRQRLVSRPASFVSGTRPRRSPQPTPSAESRARSSQPRLALAHREQPENPCCLDAEEVSRDALSDGRSVQSRLRRTTRAAIGNSVQPTTTPIQTTFASLTATARSFPRLPPLHLISKAVCGQRNAILPPSEPTQATCRECRPHDIRMFRDGSIATGLVQERMLSLATRGLNGTISTLQSMMSWMKFVQAHAACRSFCLPNWRQVSRPWIQPVSSMFIGMRSICLEEYESVK